jgi:hypothetical protein
VIHRTDFVTCFPTSFVDLSSIEWTGGVVKMNGSLCNASTERRYAKFSLRYTTHSCKATENESRRDRSLPQLPLIRARNSEKTRPNGAYFGKLIDSLNLPCNQSASLVPHPEGGNYMQEQNKSTPGDSTSDTGGQVGVKYEGWIEWDVVEATGQATSVGPRP